MKQQQLPGEKVAGYPLSLECSMACCAHSESEHTTVTVCHEVIHYPSEDYPCLCEGWITAGEIAVCGECAHPRAKHDVTRVCTPAGGERCECVEEVPA